MLPDYEEFRVPEVKCLTDMILPVEPLTILLHPRLEGNICSFTDVKGTFSNIHEYVLLSGNISPSATPALHCKAQQARGDLATY